MRRLLRVVWRGAGAERWAVVIVLVIELLAVIVYLPQRWIDPRGLTRDQWLTHVQDLRTSILQGLGGLAVLVGAVVAALNLRETSRQNRAVLELQRRGQTTERFTRAIEQLGQQGPEKLDVRIGAVYALEQIARDSAELHWPIMEVLTAYLREHAPIGAAAPAVADNSRRKRLPADHQAIATVIGRRRPQQDPEGERLDLRATDLAGVVWTGAHLDGARLSGAHLQGALLGAHLERADLEGAHLEGAMLIGAHLEGAFLDGAHLEGAFLAQAHLEEAWLHEAHGLTAAQLRAAAHPELAQLSREQAAWLRPVPAAGDQAAVLPEGGPEAAEAADPDRR